MARKGKKKRSKGGFRRRLRAAGGRARRGYRKLKRSRPKLGLVGKAGVAVAGVVPVVTGAINAVTPWVNPDYAAMNIQQKLIHTVGKFTNTLSVGFGLGETFGGAYGGRAFADGAFIPTGGWVKTTTVGITLVVTDFITGALFKFTGKSVPRTKIFGRQVLTG